jgi:cystathionine beta-lyase
VDDYAFEKSVTIYGPGKTWNIAGLPFGFAIIPDPQTRKTFNEVCYSMPHSGLLGIQAAKAAYGSAKEWRMQLVEYLKGSRDYLEKRLDALGVKHTHAEGTYLLWADFRPLGIAEPFRWLKEKARILASEGRIFGLEGYVRLNFGTNRARIKEALDRIENALHDK